MGKKPLSTKQKKANLQEKRAIKRGDIAPPEPSRPIPKRPQHGRPGTARLPPVNQDKIESARKLQSAFLKHSPAFLAHSKLLASTVPLPDPIPEDAKYLPQEVYTLPDDLGCPKRPKWRFDMAKKEVELNEEREFVRWHADTISKIDKWRNVEDEDLSRVKSPTYYERNLEVWRQL